MSTHPNLLSANDSLLIIVDLQTKLSAAMSKSEAAQMTTNVGNLVKASGLLNIPVLLTEQYPKGLGSTDAAITDLLSEDTLIFDKTGFSCCAANGFADTVASTDRKQLILVGQETHVCVLQTALELIHFGYQVHIVEDAVCSRKAEHKFYALQRMQQHGATITNYESVLFEWVKDSTHPEFKSISGLLC
jgi:nicotinamidase-related amidase